MKNEKTKMYNTIINGFKDYLEQQCRFRPGTIEGNIRCLKPFLLYAAQSGVDDIRKLSKDSITTYIDKVLSEKDTSDGYKASKIKVIVQLFDYLVSINRLLVNPVEGVSFPYLHSKSPQKLLTPSEISRLLKQPDLNLKEGFRDYVILSLLIRTGIRRGELIALNIHDLDIVKGVIYVRNKMTHKTRMIPLPEETITALNRYLHQIRPAKVRLQSSKNKFYPEQKALFLSSFGNRFNSIALKTMIQRHRKTAGIKKKVTCSILRHTFAMDLLKEKKNIEEVSKLLGHKTPESTYNAYIHYRDRFV